MTFSKMTEFCNAECHYAECRYAKCRYAETIETATLVVQSRSLETLTLAFLCRLF